MGLQPSRKPVFPPAIAPYIDVGAYLLDARAPASTLYLDKLLVGKELLLLTRSTQADPRATRQWHAYFSAAGYSCYVVDSVKGAGFGPVLDYLAGLLGQKQELARRRGMQNPVLRMAALGVPNVGKSTFLNQLLGRRRFKTGDKPGITRGYQWVRLFADVEVLDTAGVLRDPRLLNRRKACWMLLNLLVYDATLREETIELLRASLPPHAWRKLQAYYRIPPRHLQHGDWLELVESIARRRGRSAESDDDIDRTARQLLRDFQRGRFGRVTLEHAGAAPVTSPLFKAPEGWPEKAARQ